MAATLSGTYTSAPDTPSPVFPDRLIRPLPKRPIRSRISPEVAESILYPPAPPATQLFYGAYAGNGDVNDAKVFVQRNSYGFEPNPDDHHIYEDGVESDEDGPVVVRRSVGLDRSSLPHSEYVKHMGTPSKSSSNSLDGYDAFENTNNKKKRKIPTSGSLGCHSISADILNMSPSSPNGTSTGILEDNSATGSYYGSGNPVSPAGSGISGSGRGRFGRNAARSAAGRVPLANYSSNWLGNRPPGSRREPSHLGQEQTGSAKNPDQGIISTAIANAAAFPSSSPKSQGNISLLDESAKPTPAKTQFTFTCESDSSKGMASWQTQNPFPIPQQHRPASQPAPGPASGQRRFSTQGTQTSPNMASQTNPQSQAGATPPHPAQTSQPPAQGKKPRRSARSIYAFAARQRRIQQQYTNLHHPPNLEDIWICEFCEYESIFGHPPEALIRQYEIKDRKERRRLAEKRRLLEKAKMKGRKGKKAPKNAAKNAAAQQPAYHQNYDRQQMPDQLAEGHGGQDEDYGGTMEGDDYDEQAPPPPQHQQSGSVQQPPALDPGNPTQASSQSSTGLGGGGPGRAG
ncbi:hypothetical protein D8B26_006049 [Coccidioides posadasii str. Silveira]|uniref:Uncharacterized protein n=2 Tax=Coccidioides posadasii TaxID=199306 RepID=A0A0J6FET2_COCPO|nr:hypothetical protein CPC735_031740 [Coccidioides posadasii C735 delta SOWgp]EER27838.1 hypothetical protein CPC735_031740 [Coccidioides posadasii C735 delta SOWgp]KMM67770.1 hypothetical protein CPAG_04103 [Coccidioides posadasii RMSCC 3488]QVM11401.1 hypothetical protein D8B26_006049 [Coccidioides posadasii str. Silveira]|eukprot:XP_003069983.1 hypothetical protein CPC735_031740 [Coccidioides posadasii C735 delta SOWgp]